jgi:hypothetical protein
MNDRADALARQGLADFLAAKQSAAQLPLV